MNHPEDSQLIARLLGELDAEAAAEFDRRRRREPQLELRYQALLSDWNGLELAPPPVPQVGSARRMLMQRALMQRGTGRLGGQRFRVLGQLLGGAAALAAGLALGVGLGIAPTMLDGSTTESTPVVFVNLDSPASNSPASEVLIAESLSTENSSLTDTYWQLVSKDLP